MMSNKTCFWNWLGPFSASIVELLYKSHLSLPIVANHFGPIDLLTANQALYQQSSASVGAVSSILKPLMHSLLGSTLKSAQLTLHIWDAEGYNQEAFKSPYRNVCLNRGALFCLLSPWGKEVSSCSMALYTKISHPRLIFRKGLNVDIIKVFLGAKEKILKGKHCLYSHLQKYHDTILYCSDHANQALNKEYYLEMHLFLKSVKKEIVQEKWLGNLDEKGGRSHSIQPLHEDCEWAIYFGNNFLWVFMILQWNGAAWSIKIDCPYFHNFS